MKITDCILKLSACVLPTVAIICLVMANMEKISDWVACFWVKVQEKKERLCKAGCCCGGAAYEDEFEDWDV